MRKQVHLSLPMKTYTYLNGIKTKYDLSSISSAITWLIESNVQSPANDGPKQEMSRNGLCAVPGCKYRGPLTEGEYKEYVQELGEVKSVKLFMCPKHINKMSNWYE